MPTLGGPATGEGEVEGLRTADVHDVGEVGGDASVGHRGEDPGLPTWWGVGGLVNQLLPKKLLEFRRGLNFRWRRN